MGFLSGLFKRKKGGTFVGNLIRGAASKATGGILGSGAGLAAWEAKEAQKVTDGLHDQIANLTSKMNSKQMGADLVTSTLKNSPVDKTSPNAGESVVLETLKSNWGYILGGLIGLGGLIYLLVRLTKKGGSNGRLKSFR